MESDDNLSTTLISFLEAEIDSITNVDSLIDFIVNPSNLFLLESIDISENLLSHAHFTLFDFVVSVKETERYFIVEIRRIYQTGVPILWIKK